ncbi:MAG: lipoprotein, partial [Frankiales bacterium]|nr:lipoprotein [Frankiales bacterium]
NVQIDHVVSLADAWRSGASAWSYAKRLALANDPLELLAVGSAVNQAKSDGTAAVWLPATSPGRCRLARTQVAVKQKYGLTVTPPERAALTGILRGCPDRSLPGSPLPTLAPNRSPG